MSRDGINRIRNIVPACRACNQAKGSATEREYLAALKALWGRRVPRAPNHMEEKLQAIERRYAEGAAEDRAVTLLRSLAVPERLWPTDRPSRAAIAIHRGQKVPIAGSSYHSEAFESLLGDKSEWEGRVALVPEPTNPHDDQAVRVVGRGKKLGYLPKDVAARVQTTLVHELQRSVAVAAKCVVFRSPHGVGGRVFLDVPLETRTA